jgi:hypothetical protein
LCAGLESGNIPSSGRAGCRISPPGAPGCSEDTIALQFDQLSLCGFQSVLWGFLKFVLLFELIYFLEFAIAVSVWEELAS